MQLNGSAGVKRCKELKTQDRAIEKVSKGVHSKMTSMDREAIKIESQESRWIEIVITAIKKGSSKGSIDSLAVERY